VGIEKLSGNIEKTAPNGAEFLSKIWMPMSRSCPESGVKLPVNGSNPKIKNTRLLLLGEGRIILESSFHKFFGTSSAFHSSTIL
jgi:hypothetical protein